MGEAPDCQSKPLRKPRYWAFYSSRHTPLWLPAGQLVERTAAPTAGFHMVTWMYGVGKRRFQPAMATAMTAISHTIRRLPSNTFIRISSRSARSFSLGVYAAGSLCQLSQPHSRPHHAPQHPHRPAVLQRNILVAFVERTSHQATTGHAASLHRMRRSYARSFRPPGRTCRDADSHRHSHWRLGSCRLHGRGCHIPWRHKYPPPSCSKPPDLRRLRGIRLLAFLCHQERALSLPLCSPRG